MLETGEVEDTSCVLANATYAGRILRAGGSNVKPNADQCWQACKCGPSPTFLRASLHVPLLRAKQSGCILGIMRMRVPDQAHGALQRVDLVR